MSSPAKRRNDRDYHLERIRIERIAAMAATSEQARRIHNMLADLHYEIVWALYEKELEEPSE